MIRCEIPVHVDGRRIARSVSESERKSELKKYVEATQRRREEDALLGRLAEGLRSKKCVRLDPTDIRVALRLMR